MVGWIKISRDISNHWIWKDDTKLKWWLDMLLTVNFKDSKTLMGNQLIECKRGQSTMSLQHWATRWKVDKNKVRNFFVLLEKDGMILHENLSKTTRITICNYDSYQSKENDNETQPKRNQNATETQPNPIEESKEFEEGKEGEKKDLLLLEIETNKSEKMEGFKLEKSSSDFIKYYGVANGFRKMIIEKVKSSGGSVEKLKEAKVGSWVKPIRDMYVIDKIEGKNVEVVYKWLPTSDFWSKNILSTQKLREKFNQLVVEAKKSRPDTSKSIFG